MSIQILLRDTFPRDVAGIITDYIIRRDWKPAMDEVIAAFSYFRNLPKMMDRHRRQSCWARDYGNEMVRDFTDLLNNPTITPDWGWLHFCRPVPSVLLF